MKSKKHTHLGVLFGASDLTRTGDLLITSEMHYRLCYTSILRSSIIPIIFHNVNRKILMGLHTKKNCAIIPKAE